MKYSEHRTVLAGFLGVLVSSDARKWRESLDARTHKPEWNPIHPHGGPNTEGLRAQRCR